MTSVADNPQQGPDAFLDLVGQLIATRPELTPIQASILIAAQQDIAHDSRTFARLLGLSHALVLRELNTLLQADDVLKLIKRDPRTLRTHYVLGRAININAA
ncbi:MAG: hypothetical protein KTR23_13700 [Rhodospirillales bacterium]|nr:hypothetical protein [Rhodospirillales bacterium]